MRVLVILSMLLVAGCAGFQARLQARLPQACLAASEAHAAFIIVAATGTIKRGIVRKEQVAWEGVEALCAKETIDIVTVAELYAVIISALREARR